MTDESTEIDAIDLRIIGSLAQDGRMSWKDLGDRVHLAASSVGERVRRLERAGVLTGYRAEVDPAALGRGLRAVLDLRLAPEAVPERFESLLAGRAEVVTAAAVTGSAGYTLVVDCAGTAGLDALLRWCRAHGAEVVESRVVLRRVVG